MTLWPAQVRRTCVHATVDGRAQGSHTAQVFIGTENGSLGSLDIASHNYRTLLRSHTDAVNAMCIDHTGACCITGSSDGTVRVWDIATRQQQCVPPIVLHSTGTARRGSRCYFTTRCVPRACKCWIGAIVTRLAWRQVRVRCSRRDCARPCGAPLAARRGSGLRLRQAPHLPRTHHEPDPRVPAARGRHQRGARSMCSAHVYAHERAPAQPDYVPVEIGAPDRVAPAQLHCICGTGDVLTGWRAPLHDRQGRPPARARRPAALPAHQGAAAVERPAAARVPGVVSQWRAAVHSHQASRRWPRRASALLRCASNVSACKGSCICR